MECGNKTSEPFDGHQRPPRTSWDIGALSRALDQSPGFARDIAHGPGVRYEFGELIVEFFPPDTERRTGIVRLTTADSLQEFYRQPQPAIREEGLIFETSEHLISLSPTGELMTFRRVPEEGPTTPADASDIAEEGSCPFDNDHGASDDSGAAGGPFQNGLPETEGQPRVTYSGRLGIDPRTKQTPKGRFIMEFPVAVPVEEQEKPEWRSTVVFDQKARSLEGQLSKGTSVDVVAYEHRKVCRDAKTGKRQERVEYYATAVTPKPRRGTQDGPSPRGASARHRP